MLRLPTSSILTNEKNIITFTVNAEIAGRGDGFKHTHLLCGNRNNTWTIHLTNAAITTAQHTTPTPNAMVMPSSVE